MKANDKTAFVTAAILLFVTPAVAPAQTARATCTGSAHDTCTDQRRAPHEMGTCDTSSGCHKYTNFPPPTDQGFPINCAWCPDPHGGPNPTCTDVPCAHANHTCTQYESYTVTAIRHDGTCGYTDNRDSAHPDGYLSDCHCDVDETAGTAITLVVCGWES
jgi:hypothetical protein